MEQCTKIEIYVTQALIKQKKILILVRVIASNSPPKKGSKASKPKPELSLNYLFTSKNHFLKKYLNIDKKYLITFLSTAVFSVLFNS